MLGANHFQQMLETSNGKLSVRLANNFRPAWGDTVEILGVNWGAGMDFDQTDHDDYIAW